MSRLRRFAVQFLRDSGDDLPQVELESRHMEHLRALPNRLAMMEVLSKGGAVMELGVDRGVFSAEILAHNQPAELHLVDSWASARYHQGRGEVEGKFAREIQAGIVRIIAGHDFIIGNWESRTRYA
jgi:hypothetical protein